MRLPDPTPAWQTTRPQPMPEWRRVRDAMIQDTAHRLAQSAGLSLADMLDQYHRQMPVEQRNAAIDAFMQRVRRGRT